MKIPPLLFIGSLLLVGVIGFFIGQGMTQASHRQFDAKISVKEEPDKKKQENTPAEVDPTEINATLGASNPDDVPEKEKSGGSKEGAPNDDSQPQEPAPREPQINDLALGRVNLGISDDKLSEVLESIAENMENKKLEYESNLSQDCSGIFHQIKDSLQSRLPSLRQEAKYKYPQYNKDRSSRQIADWYYRNNNLLIVEDPIASRNSIRPGSVIFFGKSGKLFQNMTIDILTDRNNNYTKNGAIQHIAVVTSVTTDEFGNAKEYTMMHARYPGGPHASRSGSKEIQSMSAKNKSKVAPYPFGHWTQQWVAVANITTTD